MNKEFTDRASTERHHKPTPKAEILNRLSKVGSFLVILMALFAGGILATEYSVYLSVSEVIFIAGGFSKYAFSFAAACISAFVGIAAFDQSAREFWYQNLAFRVPGRNFIIALALTTGTSASLTYYVSTEIEFQGKQEKIMSRQVAEYVAQAQLTEDVSLAPIVQQHREFIDKFRTKQSYYSTLRLVFLGLLSITCTTVAGFFLAHVQILIDYYFVKSRLHRAYRKKVQAELTLSGISSAYQHLISEMESIESRINEYKRAENHYFSSKIRS